MMSALPNPPASLKFIQAYIARARELQNVQPIVSYYCKYYAIEKALASKVHLKDPDAADYITKLLDIVETEKTGFGENELITDDVVAQAYLEKFAATVFAKADKDIINKTCTKHTASNLLAASSLLEILYLFTETDDELAKQVRFCKFHAARILQAYRNGEDPNDYEPPAVETASAAQNSFASPPPPISPAATGVPPSASSLPPPTSEFNNLSVSDSSLRQPSAPPSSLSSAPPSAPPPHEYRPAVSPLPHPTASPAPSSYSSSTTTPQPYTGTSTPGTNPYATAPPPVTAQPYHHQQEHVSKAEITNIVDEAERFQLAQKHARYAISALNYEDVDTAIKELKTSLKLLGENIN
ncbi:Vta1 like-domain-containing protein [Limtongia smithiae]|uniref:Vta1 like-domain-containing protein n=1 Tax=Limtongia smithiae TaxID=1125753 RepID=UPI0034CFFF2C